jgi:hypothetical protein
MSMYRVDLNDNSTTVQNPISGGQLGNQRGGGMRLNFGGINSTPAWVPWAVLAAAVTGLGYLIYRKLKRP